MPGGHLSRQGFLYERFKKQGRQASTAALLGAGSVRALSFGRNLALLKIYCTWRDSFTTRGVFKTRTFTRSIKKVRLTDAGLYAAVEEMSQGLVDADLGGNVVKKRVALPGQGKRGGARTIVATRMAERWSSSSRR
ncbi:type II toxin-antitoxin system RelE/ParE family toxin [Orrella marina]|uniref:type II toxin-antitoxin system RelE/ParE family toxin n=1 Tax=Orrella marina TaxID=2163011 RepID=UPI002ACB08E9|nr:type II toxin-antitoxin system RelE/ParE family toxin [Orrella marina]